jgi:peptidoglycan/xylan/chitin deacetylase (PgdA/CDA1 family)
LRTTRLTPALILLASVSVANTAGVSPTSAGPTARTKVALTFDDLPVHGPLPPGTSRSDVARSIVATLKAAKAPPTYGFINAKGIQDAPETAEFLDIWRAAGHLLGNHTFSHMDLHKSSVEAFEQDTLANEKTLQASMGSSDWHWFRYPYLREGDTTSKRHAVAAFLKDHGYRAAEVTLSFDDYAYNDPYARCLAAKDSAGTSWLKESYSSRAAAELSRGREEARRLYGHDIGHVMLLHVGAFQMVMLPRLMELLDQHGFDLVTLPEAQADPAYAEADADVPTPGGATLLQRTRMARGLAADSAPDDTLARLAALCR